MVPIPLEVSEMTPPRQGGPPSGNSEHPHIHIPVTAHSPRSAARFPPPSVQTIPAPRDCRAKTDSSYLTRSRENRGLTFKNSLVWVSLTAARCEPPIGANSKPNASANRRPRAHNRRSRTKDEITPSYQMTGTMYSKNLTTNLLCETSASSAFKNHFRF